MDLNGISAGARLRSMARDMLPLSCLAFEGTRRRRRQKKEEEADVDNSVFLRFAFVVIIPTSFEKLISAHGQARSDRLHACHPCTVYEFYPPVSIRLSVANDMRAEGFIEV